MWMSEAPRFSESTSSTFVSLMTGAAFADCAHGGEVDLVVIGLDRLDVRLGIAHRVEVDLRQAADRGHVVDAQAGAVHRLLEAAAARMP